jgi:hypothetical protein
LPTVGRSEQVINDLETLKAKDVDWQGKCSGTVYVHLFLTNNTLKLAAHYVPIMVANISLLPCQNIVGFFLCRYIAGSESEGHFELINKAYSMYGYNFLMSLSIQLHILLYKPHLDPYSHLSLNRKYILPIIDVYDCIAYISL